MRVAGALHPNSGVEPRILRRVLQIIRKVGQLMQKYVGRKRANGAGEGRAIEDVADDRLSAGGSQPAGFLGRPRHCANGVTGVNE
jgi:hypothetical protein